MLLLLSVLAVWKITETLIEYDGPLNSIRNLRNYAKKHQGDFTLISFDCHFCLSTIISIYPAFVLANSTFTFIIYWFSISALSTILQRTLDRLEI